MKSEIRWLRISYITGAVADGLVGILLLIPDRMGETEFRYPMGIAASLMFGWAFLLVWANRKPVERKGVLLLTIFPVITGLLIAGVAAVASGIFPFSKIILSSLLEIGLIALFGYSYVKARKL
jgi:hypothetical protein